MDGRPDDDPDKQQYRYEQVGIGGDEYLSGQVIVRIHPEDVAEPYEANQKSDNDLFMFRVFTVIEDPGNVLIHIKQTGLNSENYTIKGPKWLTIKLIQPLCDKEQTRQRIR
jgi:hypothetical protein